MIDRSHNAKGTEVTYLPGMTKEQQIRVIIIPQLEGLSCNLLDTGYFTESRKLDKIINQLTDILNEGEELK